MNDNSDSEINKEINESQFFEENSLYISGKIFKKSLEDINKEFDSLENLFQKEDLESIKNDLIIDDIKINDLEEDVENLIKSTINSQSELKHKKLFVLKNENYNNTASIDNNVNNLNESKDKEENNNNNKKKVNYLRNEAKVLEETMSKNRSIIFQRLFQAKRAIKSRKN